MDGNCLPDQAIIGSGGVIRDHNSGWIAGFFSFENSGDYTKIEISTLITVYLSCFGQRYQTYLVLELP